MKKKESVPYNRKIASAIDFILKKRQLNYQFDQQTGNFQLIMGLECQLQSVHCYILVRDTNFSVYAYSPVSVPKDDPIAMSAMLDFISRANYGLANGNFEVDVRDGEIRYKTFLDCTEGIPPFGAIERNLMIPVLMFERYGQGILHVCMSLSTPQQAIHMCEPEQE